MNAVKSRISPFFTLSNFLLWQQPIFSICRSRCFLSGAMMGTIPAASKKGPSGPGSISKWHDRYLKTALHLTAKRTFQSHPPPAFLPCCHDHGCGFWEDVHHTYAESIWSPSHKKAGFPPAPGEAGTSLWAPDTVAYKYNRCTFLSGEGAVLEAWPLQFHLYKTP